MQSFLLPILLVTPQFGETKFLQPNTCLQFAEIRTKTSWQKETQNPCTCTGVRACLMSTVPPDSQDARTYAPRSMQIPFIPEDCLCSGFHHCCRVSLCLYQYTANHCFNSEKDVTSRAIRHLAAAAQIPNYFQCSIMKGQE